MPRGYWASPPWASCPSLSSWLLCRRRSHHLLCGNPALAASPGRARLAPAQTERSIRSDRETGHRCRKVDTARSCRARADSAPQRESPKRLASLTSLGLLDATAASGSVCGMYRRSGERARNDTRRMELVEFTELFGVSPVISARLGARMAPGREGRCVIRSSNCVERIPTGPEGSLEYAFGLATRERYWRILERLLAELGYRDGLGAAVQRYRSEHPREVETSPRGRVGCRAFGRRPERRLQATR
jgi:hypothetical protein